MLSIVTIHFQCMGDMSDCSGRVQNCGASSCLFGEPIGPQPPVRRNYKTQRNNCYRMSKLSIENVSIKIKRKRAPVWPFATRDLCEQAV